MRTSGRDIAVTSAHLVAAGVVVVGVAVQVARPLAPDLGPAPPAAAWFDAEHLRHVQDYRQPLYVAGLAVIALRLAVPCAAAFTSAGRRLVDRIVRGVGAHRPARAAAAVVLGVIVTTDLVVLPLAFWATFVHEGTFGFRTQSAGGWIYDWVVTTVPAWLVVGLLVVGGYALASRVEREWAPVAGLAAAGLTAGLVFLSPLLLEPLVLNTRPLQAGAVRGEAESVLERAGQDIERILVADASRRTTKRNAYISGLGASRRVVLYDTLVDGQPADEVGMVLAHEIGHAQNRDVVRGTFFAAAAVVAMAYLLAVLVRWRARSGRQSGMADPRAAAVVLAVVIVVGALSAPVQNGASRRAEAAADLAALRLTGAPATYLRLLDELARTNLSDPRPPRWAQLLWSTHPSPSARLEMGRRWDEGLLR